MAIEACLSHRLKRRALGLFKTNSSTALVGKIAKLCPEAREAMAMVETEERRQQDELKRQKKHSGAGQQQAGDQSTGQRSPPRQVAASNLSVHKRNMWIKCALIERKLVPIVEHLAENAARYYEPEALMANRVSAQLLCSLLVGPCALEFSRSKTNDVYQFEEPNADELLKRHKLSNPVVCLCSPNQTSRLHGLGSVNQRSPASATLPLACAHDQHQVSRSLSTSTGANLARSPGGRHGQAHSLVRSSTEGRRGRAVSQSSFKELEIHEEERKQSNESPLVRKSSGSGRRRPLALRTNIKTGALVTECHHSVCQEISEHQQTRGYSFTSTINNSSSSNNSTNKHGQRQESLTGTLSQSQHGANNQSLAINCSSQSSLASQETAWSAWSPRMLHETLHQNSKSSLLYAKNNVLLETNAHGTIAGYLSLHQTSSSGLILKWIPNQLINGGHIQPDSSCCCQQRARGPTSGACSNDNHGHRLKLTRNTSKCSLDSAQAAKSADSAGSAEGTRSSSLSHADELQADGSCDECRAPVQRTKGTANRARRRRCQGRSNASADCCQQQADEQQAHESTALRQSQAIGSSYLDLVICLSVSRIVLLHCHFNDQPTSEFFGATANEPPDGSGESKMLTSDLEETLILVEADGVQRAPFRFPKGGLRWFLSCLENGLGPGKYLEPAIRPDESETDLNNNSLGNCATETESGWRSLGRKAAFSVGSDSPSTVSEPASSPANSRLEMLLRRLPSLRRAAPISSLPVAPKSHSAELTNGSDAEGGQPPVETSTVPEPDTADCISAAAAASQQRQRSINYVYRIVAAAHQSDWPQETPPPLSALSMDSSSSGSFLLAGASGRLLQKRRQQMSSDSPAGVSQRFSWSLSKLARFSSPRTNSMASSTSSQATTTGNGNSNNNGNTPANDSASSRSKSTLGSLTSLLYLGCSSHNNNGKGATLDSVGSLEDQDQSPAPIKRDSSSELLRIEAKLKDLQVGSSEQLVLLRNQSIQTLCESMRKQILARAFYGWLVYCRRMKIVRAHLLDLLSESRLAALGVKRSASAVPNDTDTEADGEDEEEEEEQDDARDGLTWARWRQLQPESANRTGAKLATALARRVNRLVYYGGIEDNQLRAEVWPYLLGHYKFEDSAETRRQRDEACRDSFEAGARDWAKIERVIKERDSEILAANMAKVARRQRRERQAAGGLNLDDQQEQAAANGFSSLTSGTSDQDSADLLREDEHETAERETNDKKSGQPEDKSEEHENGSANGSDRPSQQQAKTKSRAIARRQRRMRRRFRLESTGSVGSDASITDQFGNNIHRIDKDVQRCDRNFWYFKETKNLDRLRKIMCGYVWTHLDVGYVQGMCDLAAPILVIFDHDELMAFNCFSQLMKRMVANFPQGSAMDKHFEHLKYLMQVLDPKLFEILQNNGDYTHFYFCYRWLLLDFKRELAYDDVYRVWETIWSARVVATEHFVVFLALAMVRFYRDIIIENNMDFTDTIKFFNGKYQRTKRRFEFTGAQATLTRTNLNDPHHETRTRSRNGRAS